MRGEVSVAELRRTEGVAQTNYYKVEQRLHGSR
jgi:hypothetical protein